MHMKQLILATAVMFIYMGATAQTTLPTPRNIEKTYTRGTRSLSGKPGDHYWQNRADYDIDVHYYPATRRLSGLTDITYFNNSTDTLRQIWFKLYANYYKKGAPRDRTLDPEDIGDGMIIDQLLVNGKSLDVTKLNINSTNMVLPGIKLLPGQSVSFHFAYHYTLNKGSHNRTGEVEPNAAFIAYFFPRVAVYDDIDGWNTFPYTGTQEFYNDFCHFNARVTVPSSFVVWATGDLKNGNNVFTPSIYQRIRQAEQQDAILTVIDSTDIKAGTVTNREHPENTWQFEADNVTDFVFATSDHYMWQSSSVVVDPATGRRTRVDAAFNPKHKDYFLVASDARKTVEAMSYSFPAWPFPYPHETVIDGLDQMEYPMMVNDNPLEDRAESVELTDHEIFHTFFPFYMGINETKYAWMDEGWATIGEWLISPMIDSTLVDEYGVGPTGQTAGNETDLPIVTPSTELLRGYFTNSYPKPAMGYLFIKDYLGDALFTKALHNYMEQWHGRHPMPNDFFYCMNAGAGKDLNWFWKKWFFEGSTPDLAITSATHKGNKLTVVVTDKGGRPVPVDLVIYYADGTKEKIHRTIGVWEKGAKSVTISATVRQDVTKVVLSDPHTPDSNRADNTYSWK